MKVLFLVGQFEIETVLSIETSPINQQILDQLVHHRENKAIRGGQESTLMEGGENQEVANEKKLNSYVSNDWVLHLNGGAKSLENKQNTEEFNTSSTPTSIFPRPDFALIQPGGGVPPEVEQNTMEERKRVDAGI